MPRESLLTLEKRAKIDALSAKRLTLANNARKLNCTVIVVKRYLSTPREYVKRLFTTGNTKMSKRDFRNILREASKEISSASQLRSTLNLAISKRRVQQVFSAQDSLSYRGIIKLLHSPNCTKNIV